MQTFHVRQNADLYILRVVHGNGIEGLRNKEEKKMRKLKRCSTLFASFLTIAMALTTTQLPIYANDKANNSTNMLLAIMFVMLSGGFIALNTIKKGYKNK